MTECGITSGGEPCREQGRGVKEREMRGNISYLEGRFLRELIGVVPQIGIPGKAMFIDICISINSTPLKRHGFSDWSIKKT